MFESDSFKLARGEVRRFAESRTATEGDAVVLFPWLQKIISTKGRPVTPAGDIYI